MSLDGEDAEPARASSSGSFGDGAEVWSEMSSCFDGAAACSTEAALMAPSVVDMVSEDGGVHQPLEEGVQTTIRHVRLYKAECRDERG